MNRSLGAPLLCVLSMTIAPAVTAQAVKSSVEAAAATGTPEFVIPKVAWSGRLRTSARTATDRSRRRSVRNPRAGPTAPRQAALQRAIAEPVGSVPVPAGPTVPVVNLEITSLCAVPGQRWQAVMYIDNNSGNPIDPIIECHFTDDGNRSATPGQRFPDWGRACGPGSSSRGRGSRSLLIGRCAT